MGLSTHKGEWIWSAVSWRAALLWDQEYHLTSGSTTVITWLCVLMLGPGMLSAVLFFFCLFVFEDLFILCIWVHCSCPQTHQKRASDLITDGCEPPCGCWELNSGLWKSRHRAQPLSHLSSPLSAVLISRGKCTWRGFLTKILLSAVVPHWLSENLCSYLHCHRLCLSSPAHGSLCESIVSLFFQLYSSGVTYAR